MLDQLKLILPELKSNQRYILAYSGGLDSHVLLHLLAQIIPEKLFAVHINHGWSANAKDWEQHCQKICDELKIPCQIISIDAKPANGESAEAFAREKRYQALAAIMREGDYLLTAHQQDDQAETLLLQLFRGAGVKGLAAMPVCTPFAQGFHLRPLLEFSRADIKKYAEENHLQWIEDESNTNLRFDRSYIRQTLMPLIKDRWPAAAGLLTRSANHCAQAAQLLDNLAEEDLKHIANTQKKTLLIDRLLQLNEIRRNNVMRFWIQQQGFSLPTKAQLDQINQTILWAKPVATPEVKWSNAQVRRYQNDLYIFESVTKKILPAELAWDLQHPLEIPGLGKLNVVQEMGKGIAVEKIKDSKVMVRFRRGGERFHPAVRQGSHPLKKLMQEWHIPPWGREHIPLIYFQDELIAVVGYAIHNNYAAQKNKPGWVIVFASQ